MSAGVDVHEGVWGHGFINFGGGKLSKSAGVRVELAETMARHGPEALRYYLMADVPWNGDGDLSLERFDERYVADLANNFGNLVNRTLSMIERYRQGVVPNAGRTSLDQSISAALLKYRGAMDANLLHHGAAAAIELASAANGYIEERAPWKQAKDPSQSADLDETLGALARGLAAVSTMLSPFLPSRMSECIKRLGSWGMPKLDEIVTLDLSGQTVTRGDVLFLGDRPYRAEL
jgi:methionyl-tRNA synthetase